MPRYVTERVPAVTMLFGPAQLRPRSLLNLHFTGYGSWMANYAGASMSRMIAEHRTGVVVRQVDIDYHCPDLAFGDSDWLTVRTRFGVDADRKRLRSGSDYLDDHGAAAASCRLEARIVRLGKGADMAASPGVLPDELADKFADDEHTPSGSRAALRDILPPEDAQELVPRQEWTFPILRAHCEAADQWLFVEMVDLAGQARERLYAEGLLPPDATQRAIAAPTRTIRAVFHRPMFVFDHCQITTNACVNAKGETVFHHQFGPPGSLTAHLTVVETLDQTGDTS